MQNVWNILTFIISSGLFGIFVSIYHNKSQNNDSRQIRAIEAGLQINIISNNLNDIINTSENNLNERNMFIQKAIIYKDLIYLNAWSEYVCRNLLSHVVMYETAYYSLQIFIK